MKITYLLHARRRMRERKYIAAGGDPKAFEKFWENRSQRLIEERLAAAALRGAHPRDYSNGWHGATFGPLN